MKINGNTKIKQWVKLLIRFRFPFVEGSSTSPFPKKNEKGGKNNYKQNEHNVSIFITDLSRHHSGIISHSPDYQLSSPFYWATDVWVYQTCPITYHQCTRVHSSASCFRIRLCLLKSNRGNCVGMSWVEPDSHKPIYGQDLILYHRRKVDFVREYIVFI